MYEIIDASDDTWYRAKLVIRSSRPTNTRVLYEYIEPCTSSSRSMAWYLSSSIDFRGYWKEGSALRSLAGIRSLGVRILPPQSSRKSAFKHPPVELLSQIFGFAVADKVYANWHPSLISFALVCRAWTIALEHLYHDFGEHSSGKHKPDPHAVSLALIANPSLGRPIWRFSTRHWKQNHVESDKTYLERSKDYTHILHSATS